MSETYDKDPYEVLGVSRDADDATIKKAYRKLALTHHPDRKSDPAEKQAASRLFADIAGAYEILTDETMRKEWDRENGNGGSGSAASGAKTSSDKKRPKGFKFNPSDPYEVWKRDFEIQFGRPYPGAAADFVSLDTHIFQKREGPTEVRKIDKRQGGGKGGTQSELQNGKKREMLRLENGKAADESDPAGYTEHHSDQKSTKKKGFFARLFGGKKRDKEQGPSQDDAPMPAAPSSTVDQNEISSQPRKATNREKSSQKALVPSTRGEKDPANERALALRNNERSIVEHEGEPAGHDNRPISMEVTVEEGADGSTITTTTITRPDGTVEKCVQRTGIPGKDPRKLAQLEGETTKLAIEDDKDKKLAIQDGKKRLAIENGATKTKGRQTNAKGQKLITAG